MSSRRDFFSALVSLGQVREPVKEIKVVPFFPLLPGFVLNTEQGCVGCTTPVCKSVCPEGIVVREGTAPPYLDFSKRGCTFCGECRVACQSDCFVDESVNSIKAEVFIETSKCLAWNQTICRTCADVCNEKAIQFTGLWQPKINLDTCTACGFCIGMCPADTIKISPLKEVA